jgi:branched-chain amino acid transport system permease protein
MHLNPRLCAVYGGLAMLALVPPVTAALDEPFYVTLVARIMIFAIAAVSLDLILGFGGMVSFGHAAYLGTGGYAVAVLSFYGIDNGFLQFAVAIAGSALVALVIGAICLRTSGVYFLMITLAFTQMLFFLGISIEEFGGDDGLNTNRSEFFEAMDLADDTTLYYFIFACLAVCLYLARRMVRSRFGMVVQGARSNEPRMRALGFPTYRYKLCAFVIAGAMCGVAGALLANLTEFVTPEYMNWFRSGEIMVMVLMGGMGTVFGPLFGAVAFLLLEEVLSSFTQHWMIIFGPLLVILVLFAKRGLFGLIPEPGESPGEADD